MRVGSGITPRISCCMYHASSRHTGQKNRLSPILVIHSIKASSSSGSTCNILPGKGLPSYLTIQNLPINVASRSDMVIQESGAADFLFLFFVTCLFTTCCTRADERKIFHIIASAANFVKRTETAHVTISDLTKRSAQNLVYIHCTRNG